jgi:hypothetical protein
MEKSSPEMCATSVIFKPLTKVNNQPLGKNSPNLVTLPPTLAKIRPIWSLCRQL